MDPLLVTERAEPLERWIDAALPLVCAAERGRERDVVLAEYALLHTVTSRWLGRRPGNPAAATAWPSASAHGRGHPSTPAAAAPRADSLGWRHLAVGAHGGPACERLTVLLSRDLALSVVASDPHRRYAYAYLAHLLAANDCPAGRDMPVVADWPRTWTAEKPQQGYELTHAAFWLSDFGERGWAAGAAALDASDDHVQGLLAAATDRFIGGDDVDLALELALARLLLGNKLDHRASAPLARAAAPAPPPPDHWPLHLLRAAIHPRIVALLLIRALTRHGMTPSTWTPPYASS